MTKKNKLYYSLVAGLVVVVTGAGLLLSQGDLLQGKLSKIDVCKNNPKGITKVTSWVPTKLTSYKIPKTGYKKIVKIVPCSSVSKTKATPSTTKK